MPYPIAIAIIETASAVFKPNDEYGTYLLNIYCYGQSLIFFK